MLTFIKVIIIIKNLNIVLSKHWGKSRGEYSFLPKIKSSEPLSKKLEYDSRLVMNRLGEYYLCIPKSYTIINVTHRPDLATKYLGIFVTPSDIEITMIGR